MRLQELNTAPTTQGNTLATPKSIARSARPTGARGRFHHRNLCRARCPSWQWYDHRQGNVINCDAEGRIQKAAYNADGQPASHTYPDGSQANYSYSQGQLQTITIPGTGEQIDIGGYDWILPHQQCPQLAPGLPVAQDRLGP